MGLFLISHVFQSSHTSVGLSLNLGLRNLFREGVNLEVMSADVIMEEMRVDGIPATDDERLKHYISRRYAWSGPVVKAKVREKNLCFADFFLLLRVCLS